MRRLVLTLVLFAVPAWSAIDFEIDNTEYCANESAALFSAVPYTFSFWATPESAASQNPFGNTDTSGTHAVRVDFFGSGGQRKVRMQVVGSSAAVGMLSGTFAYTAGTPIFIAGRSASTSDHAFWHDTTKLTSSTDAGSFSGLDAFTLGAIYTEGSSPQFAFDGTISEVGVWDTDLTDAEISALQSGLAPILVRPDSLIFYAPMVRSGDCVDIVGNFAMTPFNTPTTGTHHRIIK